jgi:hypothetical protein
MTTSTGAPTTTSRPTASPPGSRPTSTSRCDLHRTLAVCQRGSMSAGVRTPGWGCTWSPCPQSGAACVALCALPCYWLLGCGSLLGDVTYLCH